MSLLLVLVVKGAGGGHLHILFVASSMYLSCTHLRVLIVAILTNLGLFPTPFDGSLTTSFMPCLALVESPGTRSKLHQCTPADIVYIFAG